MFCAQWRNEYMVNTTRSERKPYWFSRLQISLVLYNWLRVILASSLVAIIPDNRSLSTSQHIPIHHCSWSFLRLVLGRRLSVCRIPGEMDLWWSNRTTEVEGNHRSRGLNGMESCRCSFRYCAFCWANNRTDSSGLNCNRRWSSRVACIGQVTTD